MISLGHIAASVVFFEEPGGVSGDRMPLVVVSFQTLQCNAGGLAWVQSGNDSMRLTVGGRGRRAYPAMGFLSAGSPD